MSAVVMAPGAAHAVIPTPPTVAETEARLELYAEFDPAGYESVFQAIDQYGTDADGNVNFTLVPSSVVATLNPTIWNMAKAHAGAVNTYIAGDEQNTVDQADGISSAALKQFLKWVSKNWNRIVSAAKASGKYAWYKAHRCAYGAATKVYNASGGSMSNVVGAYETYIYIAIRGCIAAL